MVDSRLHHGIRAHAVLPPISLSGTLLSIRVPRLRPLSLDDLASAGLFDAVPLSTISALVERRATCSSIA